MVMRNAGMGGAGQLRRITGPRTGTGRKQAFSGIECCHGSPTSDLISSAVGVNERRSHGVGSGGGACVSPLTLFRARGVREMRDLMKVPLVAG